MFFSFPSAPQRRHHLHIYKVVRKNLNLVWDEDSTLSIVEPLPVKLVSYSSISSPMLSSNWLQICIHRCDHCLTPTTVLVLSPNYPCPALVLYFRTMPLAALYPVAYPQFFKTPSRDGCDGVDEFAVVEVNIKTMDAYSFAITGLPTLLREGRGRERKEIVAALYTLCCLPDNHR
ncbi:hypothetical protein L1887_34903 [Cichorium endivia]|nr:hypothetical protein L1887_34903 [Cichorium endivia]